MRGINIMPKAMPKATVATCAKISKIMWQTNDDDIGEPALLLEGYSDVLNVTQGKSCISLNYETLDELLKQLLVLKAEAQK